jgi:tryptophan-rich sensory protein
MYICGYTRCMAAFQPLNAVATGLMAPTLVWVSIAAKLNWDIVQLNLSAGAATQQ